MNVKKLLCPICKEDRPKLTATVRDIEYQSSKDIYTYYQCSNCDVVFLDSPPVDKLDIIYPDHYYSYSNQKTTASFLMRTLLGFKDYLDSRIFTGLLNRLNTNDISVLDVGGGTGFTVDAIRKIDSRVNSTLIIDIDQNAEDIALANGHEFSNATIEKAKIDRKFDLVIMLNLIEHVEDPYLVLQKIFNNTITGGYVVIKTPNTNSLNFKIFNKSYWGGYHAPRHFVLFNETNILDLCQRVGFSEVEIKFTQGAPQWASTIYGIMHHKSVMASGEFPTKIFANHVSSLMLAVLAVFDFTLGRFFGTDQMFVIIKK